MNSNCIEEIIISPLKKSYNFSQNEIKKITAEVPQNVKDDIDFACQQVYDFAKAQRNSIDEFYTKNNGVEAGQKLLPVNRYLPSRK